MTGALWQLFFEGLWITVQLMVYSAALAAAVAFGIGLARTSRFWIFRFLSGVYVEFFRGTSALVLMFWLFFALPLLGWQLVGIWALHPGAGAVVRRVRLRDRPRRAAGGGPRPA